MIRKTASVTLTAFLRTEEKSASVGMMKYVAALSGFLNHLGLHKLQLVRGE
jgi:hypothetical protein